MPVANTTFTIGAGIAALPGTDPVQGGTWTATAGSANSTLTAPSTGGTSDGSGQTGCLQFSISGKSHTDADNFVWAGTWNQLGVPTGATVISVQWTYAWSCTTFTTGASSSIGAAGTGINNSGGTQQVADASAASSFSGTTSFADHVGSVMAVPAAISAGSTSIQFEFAASMATGASNSAVVTLVLDNIRVAITYTVSTYAVLQSKSNGVANASSVAVTFTTANLSAGTKLIAWVVLDNQSSIPSINSVQDGAGNSFTLVPGATASGNVTTAFILASCFTLDTPAADVGTKPTITATLSAAVTTGDVSILVQEVSGLAPGDAHDGTAGVSTPGGTASIAQPAYSSAAADEYLTAFFGDSGNGQTFTAPAGYTADASNVNTSGTNDIAVIYKNSTGSAESGTWTFTGSNSSSPNAFIVVAFKPAIAGPELPALPGYTLSPLSKAFGPNPPFEVLEPGPPPPVVAVTSGPPIYPLLHPVAAVTRPLPARGRTYSRAGTFGQLGPLFFQQPKPLQARRPLPPRGRTGSNPGVYNQVGPPFHSDSSPVASGGTSAASTSRNGARLPARGRTASNAGIRGQLGSQVYPLQHPVAAVTRPLPPRGRTYSRAGIYGQLGPQFFAQPKPLQARRPLPPRGRSYSNAGAFGQLGPQVYPLQRPVRARQPLPRKGRTAASLVTPAVAPPPNLTVAYLLQHPVVAAIRVLPKRGRASSNAGTFGQLGPQVYPLQRPVAATSRPRPPRGTCRSNITIPFAFVPPQPPPLPGPVQARRPLPLRGRTATSAAPAPVAPPPNLTVIIPPGRPVAAVVRPLPSRGRTYSRTGTYGQLGTPVAALQQPAGVRRVLLRQGSAQADAGPIGILGPPVYPLLHPIQARRPLPARGRISASFAPAPVTPPPNLTVYYPLGHPVQARRPLPPRGTCRTNVAIPYQFAPPAPPPLQGPIQARRPLPSRGRTASNPGAPVTAAAANLTVYYPLGHPAAAVVRPLPRRGRTGSNAGIRNQTGPTFYPGSSPVACGSTSASGGSRNGARLPVRGRIASSNVGTRGQLGPQVYPLQRPVSAITRPLPRRGRISSNVGIRQQTGPTFYQLNHPLKAVQPLPPRGRTAARYGVFTSVTPVTAPFFPLNRPVAAVTRPLPPRGRDYSNRGVFNQVGPPVKALQRPIMAFRNPIRPGYGVTSIRVAPPATLGPPVYPLHGPVRAAYPRLHPRAGGVTAQTLPYVKPAPPVPQGGHGYPYTAILNADRWPAQLRNAFWLGAVSPDRYEAISVLARWPAQITGPRWEAAGRQ